MFDLRKQSKKTQARLGMLTTAHGEIHTPFFMPIATRGTVKTLTTQDMQRLNAQIILSNTYHLYLRPGTEVLQQAGGLHNFMQWQGPILTDSGGYQVFSLAGTKNRKGGSLVTIKENGVEFQSYIDGSKHFLTPEEVLQIQHVIGSDIMMILDVCTANPATHEQAAKDIAITTAWAKKARQEYAEGSYGQQLCFGIVQGSTFEDLRKQSATELVELDFSGYAIGGLAVGETHEEMYSVLEYTTPLLPKNKPRYLMGVGRPENIIEAVKRGVDMFDCVIPTREARHGRLYVWESGDITGSNCYTTITITNSEFEYDMQSINAMSEFEELQQYSKAYLHHLFRVNEQLALRLATLNNIEFYLQLLQKIRTAIAEEVL